MTESNIINTISVASQSSYQVIIGHGLAAEVVAAVRDAKAQKAAIVVQPPLRARAEEYVAQLANAGVQAIICEIPDAEYAKDVATLAGLWDELGAAGFSRSDCVIGLGGGAATDLAGFLAATWMRGIKVIQVPTSLLAMVDAAVGGKTGINTAAGKNLVGAFHEPFRVIVDLDFLVDLPREELVSGSAEIIKTGFIADPEILAIYEASPERAMDVAGDLPELVARSIAVKGRVVAADLKESSLREILNYGHTFGHAIELNENYSWRHGNAVAVGMVFVAELAHARGLIDAELVQRHRDILASVGLPTSYPQGSFDALYDAMTRDKKNRAGAIRFVGITAVGETTRIKDSSIEELRAAYQAIAR